MTATAQQATAKGHFATFLHDNGYRYIRDLCDGRYAAVLRFLFTTAIITGRWGDQASYEDRWCYHTEAAAKAALDAWDGLGEPTGWHRHPNSGRRVSDDGKAYVAP